MSSPRGPSYTKQTKSLEGLSVMDLLNTLDTDDPKSIFRLFYPHGPAPLILSADEARARLKDQSSSVLRKWDELRDILRRHEATIQTRWLKKAPPQRVTTLHAAHPAIPASHRPDFEAYRAAARSNGKAAARTNSESAEVTRNAYMMPYINVQDLSKPWPLLLLLNSRKQHPSVFAAADRESMHIGIGSRKVMPAFLGGHIVMLNGVQDRAEYGRLVSYSERPDASAWVHDRRQLMPGEALLVLEAQNRLMEFLVKCCRHILRDIPSTELSSRAYPEKPEANISNSRIRYEKAANGENSLSIMALEGPYRVPANLSLSKIETLLSAATAACEDHLWSLREDPSYFHDEIIEASEHDQAALKDTQGRPHPILKPHHKHVFWYHVIGGVVYNGYMNLEMTSLLWRQSQRLQTLHEKYGCNISHDKPLPKEYLDAILEFRYLLQRAIKGPLKFLGDHGIPSRPLRRFFVREPGTSPYDTRTDIRSTEVKQDDVEEQLLWLLKTLWQDGYRLSCLRVPTVVDELQRLLDAEPKAAGMITPFVERIIGDLAIFSECLRQVDLYQPWALSFEKEMKQRFSEIDQRHGQRSAPWGRIIEALHNSNQGSQRIFSDLGDPSGRKFDYPVARRRTKENIEQMRFAEANLDAFWAEADRVVRAEAGDLQGTAIGKLLTEPRALLRTSEWSPPPKKGQAGASSVEIITKPLSELYFELEWRSMTARDEQAGDTSPYKEKVKTRGTPTRNGDTNVKPTHNKSGPAAPPTEPKQHTKIPVDGRALKVFRTLFFQPLSSATPGEVAWNDFVHAMVSVGFTAQKLYGSVWQFSPLAALGAVGASAGSDGAVVSGEEGRKMTRSIQFHESHPGKIPFRTARRHGRRLARAYGWGGGMFVLKQK